MRPTILHIGGVLYWTIQTRNPDTTLLKDADSTPTVAVRKNGSPVGDSVTITKRSATTGLYDCGYNPAAEVETDIFQFEESATVTGTTTAQATYINQFSVSVVHAGAVELDSSATDQLDAIEAGVDAGNNYHITTLARLGAWTGSGINTVLGAFRALAAKATGLTPTNISASTTFNNTLHSLEAVATTAPQRPAAVLERPPTDTGVITFAWPALGATITGTVSIDNAAYTPIAGDISFLRTDGGKYFYTLTYDAADRPATAGSARYALTDGDYTRYMVLRVVVSGDTGEATALAVLCTDWTTITGEVPSRSALNALRHIRNKWALDGNTKTVYAEDGTTPAFTTTVTADGAGNITADTPN